MKKFIKYVFSILILSFIFSSTPTLAATIPPLGTAANFSALASTSLSFINGGFINSSGSYGLSPATSASKTGVWMGGSGYFSDTAAPDNLVSFTAKEDALTAFNDLAGQTTSGAWSGTASTSPVSGVWTEASDATFNGTLTLDGDYEDVWVFQIGGNLNFTGKVVLTGHAQPCHVFWQVGGTASTTIDSEGKFVGTLISNDTATTTSLGLDIDGRIMSLSGSVVLDGGGQSSSISGPTCSSGLILKKVVDNTNGGTSLNTDWTLTATGAVASPTNLTGTTPVDSDVLFPSAPLFKADTYTLSESGGSTDYTASSWSCVGGTQVGSAITVGAGEGAVCTITNTYPVPVVATAVSTSGGSSGRRALPLIKVTKVAIPQTLSVSGGMVTYLERVSNPGLLALNNIQLRDDTCSPLNYLLGDTNRDSKLDSTEIWTYFCRAHVTKTTINTVIAEGIANGVTVKDSATATVTVVPKLPNTGFSPLPIFSRSLSMGMTGDDVSALQTVLEHKGFLTIPSGVAKGYFGELTHSAVKTYQANANIAAIGIFGPLTRAHLISDLGE